LVSAFNSGSLAINIKNSLLRRIFGIKWDEVRDGWRKHCNEERHKIFHSESIIGMIKCGEGLYYEFWTSGMNIKFR
jgi:hypothetical protein